MCQTSTMHAWMCDNIVTLLNIHFRLTKTAIQISHAHAKPLNMYNIWKESQFDNRHCSRKLCITLVTLCEYPASSCSDWSTCTLTSSSIEFNICIVKHTRTFTFNLRITCTSARRNVHAPFLADLERKLESVVVYIHACRRCLIRRRPISPRMCWSINQSVIHSQSSVYWKKTCPSCRQGPEPQYCIVVYPGLRYLNAAELILGGPEHIDPVYKPIPV